MSFALLIALLSLLLPAPLGAQGLEWSFDAGTTSRVEIPTWLPADSLRAAHRLLSLTGGGASGGRP